MGAIGSLRDLRAALARQAWLILLLSGLGVAAAFTLASSRPASYQATAVVQIEPPQVTGSSGAAGAGGAPMGGGLTASAQLDYIEQRLMARDAVAALVDRFALFPQVASEAERVGLLRGAVTVSRLIDPAQAWRPEVQPSGLTLSVRLSDAQAAAAVANALAEEVVREARARAATLIEQTLAFHRTEEARITAELDRVEGAISDLRAANTASLPEAVTSQRERLTTLSEDRITAEQLLLDFESGASRQRSDEAQRQRALLEERRDLVLQALAETQAALDAAPAVERQLGGLDRDRSALDAELAVVIADRRDAETALRLQQSEQASRFAILETALPPEFPVSTDPRKLAVAGSVAAMMAAVGLALGREVLAPAIRTSAQMRRTLGIEPLVVIPRLRSRRAVLGRRLALATLVVVGLGGAWMVLQEGGVGGLRASTLDLLPRLASLAS